jgi:Na+-driven multidrug efflux pump
MNAMFQALMRGVGQTQTPLLIVVETVLLNFVLDPVFIFSWRPISAQGVMGAAFATLITQALAAGFGMIIFLRGQHGIALGGPFRLLTWRSRWSRSRGSRAAAGKRCA